MQNLKDEIIRYKHQLSVLSNELKNKEILKIINNNLDTSEKIIEAINNDFFESIGILTKKIVDNQIKINNKIKDNSDVELIKNLLKKIKNHSQFK